MPPVDYTAPADAGECFRRSLRRVRKLRGLTQEDLARRVRISSKYLSHLETGSRENPSLETIERLARALDVQPAVLFGGRLEDETGMVRQLDLDELRTRAGRLLDVATETELHAVLALFTATRDGMTMR
jgi:transcriptional regulator with XRE-family HTH domain